MKNDLLLLGLGIGMFALSKGATPPQKTEQQRIQEVYEGLSQTGSPLSDVFLEADIPQEQRAEVLLSFNLPLEQIFSEMIYFEGRYSNDDVSAIRTQIKNYWNSIDAGEKREIQEKWDAYGLSNIWGFQNLTKNNLDQTISKW